MSRWIPESERRFRLMCFQIPKGPWRMTRKEAETDAIAAKLGKRYPGEGFYITVPGWIMETPASPMIDAMIQRREARRLAMIEDRLDRRRA